MHNCGPGFAALAVQPRPIWVLTELTKLFLFVCRARALLQGSRRQPLSVSRLRMTGLFSQRALCGSGACAFVAVCDLFCAWTEDSQVAASDVSCWDRHG